MTDPTQALGQVSPSQYAAWMSVNQNAAGANPNQEILQTQWDVGEIISGMYYNRMTFNHAWKRGYLNGFLNQRRFGSNSFDTGASEITFTPVKMGESEKGRKPEKCRMLEDKNCPPDRVFLWNNTAIMCASDYSSEPHLADEDGTDLRYRYQYDSLFGFYRFWYNYVINQRNAIGTIYGFTVSNVI